MKINSVEINIKEIITNGALNELLNLDIPDDLKSSLSLQIGKILKNI